MSVFASEHPYGRVPRTGVSGAWVQVSDIYAHVHVKRACTPFRSTVNNRRVNAIVLCRALYLSYLSSLYGIFRFVLFSFVCLCLLSVGLTCDDTMITLSRGPF